MAGGTFNYTQLWTTEVIFIIAEFCAEKIPGQWKKITLHAMRINLNKSVTLTLIIRF